MSVVTPIEIAFAQLKVFLKSTAASTANDLRQAMAEAIDLINPSEWENCFSAAGHDRER